MRSKLSRRKFLENMSVSAGAIALPASLQDKAATGRLTGNAASVKIGTVSIMDLSAADTPDMIQKVLQVMEEIIPYQPDIICLPEIFAFCNIARNNYELKDVAEKVPGAVITPFLNFAATHKCYVICPTYTLSDGNVFIAAVLIDRQGKVAGEYRKMRPAASELTMGIKAGPFNPPVFQTDFGKIGIQICFDIKYDEGWDYLKDNGAQIIFWPSAYAAGQEISSRAWRHQVYIVTSTQKDTSKICDITGEAMAQTGRWQRHWTFAPVNLEKAFILTWPVVTLFPDIQRKYGSKIRLTTYNEEEWTIIESMDPAIKINDVLKEYKLKTMHEVLRELGKEHEKARVKA